MQCVPQVRAEQAGAESRRRWRRVKAAARCSCFAVRCKCSTARLWRGGALVRASQSQANCFLPAAMSYRPSLGTTEEQKSLRELSVALTSFAEIGSADHKSNAYSASTTTTPTSSSRQITAHEQTGVRYDECFGVRLPRYRHAASGQQLAPRPCVFACAVRYAFADVAVCSWTVVRKAKGVKYVQSAFARYQPI